LIPRFGVWIKDGDARTLKVCFWVNEIFCDYLFICSFGNFVPRFIRPLESTQERFQLPIQNQMNGHSYLGLKESNLLGKEQLIDYVSFGVYFLTIIF